MLDVLNVIMLAGTVIANITFYPLEDVKITNDIETAYAVDFHREWWRSDGKGKCTYKGIMVPFVKDWNDVRQASDGLTEVVNPAQPGEMAGQALLINQKVCGDQLEIILRGGDRFRLVSGMTAYKGASIAFIDLTTTPKDLQGPWLLQVLDRLDRLAPTNPVAASFLAASPKEIAFLRALLAGEALVQPVTEESNSE